ncbi:uncharacterized protein LACBIDRAFT_296030 [Laccaria bicolor S238N-H82]|uniref:Predicted protein n=1 Tax=Laccaria bicolor (strain S238N-H82 / ATCC MYA-4686) TaxID=486041 RepID=B0E253_LACBS|nr:uncharacterized protein LACBIDRAFT_296030 [Laccaria bicolor S238N-H82]EDQ99080.1 predicted protein [Laccaria bicolor S238N-H82]|eukprot:XP_001890282.1 predicted protein [Laccaria bicolor S238N-H82]
MGISVLRGYKFIGETGFHQKRIRRSVWTDVDAHEVLITITPTVYTYEKRKGFTLVNVLGRYGADCIQRTPATGMHERCLFLIADPTSNPTCQRALL